MALILRALGREGKRRQKLINSYFWHVIYSIFYPIFGLIHVKSAKMPMKWL